MAEATDLPPGASEPAKAGAVPGPAWPGEGVTLSPAPPPPPAESAYRPLSGLALAAFLLAALYALAVTLGGVVAFAAQHYWCRHSKDSQGEPTNHLEWCRNLAVSHP